MVEHAKENDPGVDANGEARPQRLVRPLSGRTLQWEKMSFQKAVKPGAEIFCWSRGLDLDRNTLRWRLPAVLFLCRFFLNRMSPFLQPVTNWWMLRHRWDQSQSSPAIHRLRYNRIRSTIRTATPWSRWCSRLGEIRYASVPHGTSGMISPQASR